eukprot:TRINITY_DN2635_c2_g3_i1.p2 TRINITY_DN2635_c2_g3~~TRINITY_DN2635_c2_g3_i1.p2  ORF type:complete len:275 (+),score=139.73 TRINITY_DN2635_c2_g3_i1:98-826(+)
MASEKEEEKERLVDKEVVVEKLGRELKDLTKLIRDIDLTKLPDKGQRLWSRKLNLQSRILSLDPSFPLDPDPSFPDSDLPSSSSPSSSSSTQHHDPMAMSDDFDAVSFVQEKLLSLRLAHEAETSPVPSAPSPSPSPSSPLSPSSAPSPAPKPGPSRPVIEMEPKKKSVGFVMGARSKPKVPILIDDSPPSAPSPSVAPERVEWEKSVMWAKDEYDLDDLLKDEDDLSGEEPDDQGDDEEEL